MFQRQKHHKIKIKKKKKIHIKKIPLNSLCLLAQTHEKERRFCSSCTYVLTLNAEKTMNTFFPHKILQFSFSGI